MIKKLIVSLTILLSLVTGTSAMLPSQASAQVASGCDKSQDYFLGFPTWYKYLEIGPKGTDKCAIKGPANSEGGLDFQAAIPRILLAIVDILLRLAAMVSIVYVIYGGFRYILSQGEPDSTRQAKGTIITSIIGLVITIFSTAIVNLVGSTLWK